MSQNRTPYYCDICGEEIGLGENAYVHHSYAYCEKCEQIHRENEKKFVLKKKV